MVIGFDAKRAFRNNTGLGNYSRMVICGLAQAHSEVRCFLYSPSVDGEYQKFFSSYANVSTRKPSGIDRFFPNLWRRWGVTFHLRGDDIDLFHGLSHELPHGIPHSIKKVVTMHDLIVWRYPQYYKAFDRVVHRVKQRHACRIADVVVAISEQTKQDLMRFLKVPESKIRVLYQSCDQQFWQPVKESDIAYVREQYSLPEKYIICVGTVEDRKNQKNVVKAFAELPEDVHLVIVGRSHKIYGVEVKAEARSLHVSDRVHYIDDADFADFPAMYAGAIASVYASKFEGFGIPILESLCTDTPVVTSNVSSMPEAGGDAALYAAPDNPHEIAQQLLRLINDPALRQECVEKGRIQREKFSQERIVADFYNLYASLLPDKLGEDDM